MISIIAIVLAVVALATVARLIYGPSTADRLIATELLAGLIVAFIALAGWQEWGLLALDVAVGMALVGFLGSVGLAIGLDRENQEVSND